MPVLSSNAILMNNSLKSTMSDSMTLNVIKANFGDDDGLGAIKPPDPPKVVTLNTIPGRVLLTPINWSGELINAVLGLQPRPRSQVTVPISPTDNMVADTVFEDAADPNKKYALPVFNLSQASGSFRVGFERIPTDDLVNQTWQLSVWFAAAHRRQDAQDLQSTMAVLLRFTPPSSGGPVKELPFTVETQEDGTIKATMQLIGLNARDEVVNALKFIQYETHFIVRCSFSAAVLDAAHSTPDNQLYRQSSYSVDVHLDRDLFVFDPAQYPLIFSPVQDASQKVFGVTLQQLEYKGRIHHYFQDDARKYIYYYLPDSFKVTRGIDPPFAPQIIVRFQSSDGSLENMRVSMEYVAAPVIDAERLQAARLAFKPDASIPMPPGLTDAVFQPLVVDDPGQLTLKLALPRADAVGSSREPRPGVVTKLTDGFRDEIDGLTIANFQDLFDALFGKSAFLLTGEVGVAKSGDGAGSRPAESIPFEIRLDDLFGRLLVETETPGTDGRITVKLKNAIESPLTIRSVPVFISCDAAIFPAHIENLSKGGVAITFPVDLAPTEEICLDVVSNDLLPMSASAPDALFDLDDVLVKPDAAALWSAILDASVPAEYTRKISVQAFDKWFAPDTNVMAIALDFERGDHVVLDRQHLTADAHVRVPISDLVLRKVQDSQYQYTQIVVTGTGQTRAQKTDNLDILFPDLTA
jgi:hypothetical protein